MDYNQQVGAKFQLIEMLAHGNIKLTPEELLNTAQQVFTWITEGAPEETTMTHEGVVHPFPSSPDQ